MESEWEQEKQKLLTSLVDSADETLGFLQDSDVSLWNSKQCTLTKLKCCYFLFLQLFLFSWPVFLQLFKTAWIPCKWTYRTFWKQDALLVTQHQLSALTGYLDLGMLSYFFLKFELWLLKFVLNSNFVYILDPQWQQVSFVLYSRQACCLECSIWLP